ILGGLLLPSLGRLASLDRLVLLLGVTLLGHRYNCGVNDLSAARNVALGLEMLAEAFEQLGKDRAQGRRLTAAPQTAEIVFLLSRHPVFADEPSLVAGQMLLALVPDPLWWSVGDPAPGQRRNEP